MQGWILTVKIGTVRGMDSCLVGLGFGEGDGERREGAAHQ